MNCAVVELRLNHYMDGLTTEGERSAIEHHLTQCEHCHRQKEELKALMVEAVAFPKSIATKEDLWPRIENIVKNALPTEDEDEDISDPVIQEIEEAIMMRQFERIGLAMNDLFAKVLEKDPSHPCVARFLGCYGVYMAAREIHIPSEEEGGIGTSALRLLKESLQRLPATARATAAVTRLGLAEGVVAYLEENYDRAIEILQAAAVLEPNEDVVVIDRVFMAKCYARKGDYRAADQQIRVAKHLTSRPEMLADIQGIECWVLFQQGLHSKAIEMLEQARLELEEVGDHDRLGDLNFCQGRVFKREGRFAKALDYYAMAAEEYERVDAKHPALARVKVKKAHVEILIAQQLRRNGYYENIEGITKMWLEAEKELDEAAQIFERRNQDRGLADVWLTKAGLNIERGRLVEAEEQCIKAHTIGKDREDSIIVGRAAAELCRINNLRGDDPNKEQVPGYSALKALDWADVAVENANKTQNRPLLAKAHIRRGWTLAGAYFNDPVEAKKCYDQAEVFLTPRGRDNVQEEFIRLGQKLSAYQAALGPVPATPDSIPHRTAGRSGECRCCELDDD